MDASSPADHSSSSSSRPQRQPLPHVVKLVLTFALYALVPLALLHYLLTQPPPPAPLPPTTADTISSPSPPQQEPAEKVAAVTAPAPAPVRCDYSDGEWVPSAAAPLYNGTSCGGTIKAAQNCMAHGRPDTGYLRWRWRPRGCALRHMRAGKPR